MQGIYGIYNKVEKQWWYIGQSIDIEGRIKAHKGSKYKTGWHIYFREHPDEFDCVELEWVALRQNLLAREAHYIKKLNPKYTTIEANKGSQVGPLTDETKAKISGENSPVKRPEVRAKISASLKGKHFSDEHKAKLSAVNKGKHHSDETKAKISASNTGKHHSDETKAKISASNTGKHYSDEVKAKLSLSQKISQNRPETKAKKSASMKGKHVGENNPAFGTKWMHKPNEKPIQVKKCNIKQRLNEGYILGIK